MSTAVPEEAPTAEGNAAKGRKKDGDGGGWTKQEHVRFLKGLEVFGANWKHISYVVKTRTSKDVQIHANSYFGRQKKPRAELRKRSIHDITVETLRELEARLGTDQGFVWDAPEDDMPKRGKK